MRRGLRGASKAINARSQRLGDGMTEMSQCDLLRVARVTLGRVTYLSI